MSHPGTDMLNDFADGLLAGDDRVRVQEHLRECSPCRSEVEWVRALKEAAARGLPDVEPPRDLWPGIGARIRAEAPPVEDDLSRRRQEHPSLPPGHRPWVRPLLLAAAGLVLMLTASGVTLMLVRSGGIEDFSGTGRTAVQDTRGPGDSPVRAASLAQEVEAAYDPAIRELREALESGRDDLDPETVRILEENLRIIDEAITEAREALEADPANPAAARSLNGMYETKLQVLRQAASLARGA